MSGPNTAVPRSLSLSDGGTGQDTIDTQCPPCCIHPDFGELGSRVIWISHDTRQVTSTPFDPLSSIPIFEEPYVLSLFYDISFILMFLLGSPPSLRRDSSFTFKTSNEGSPALLGPSRRCRTWPSGRIQQGIWMASLGP